MRPVSLLLQNWFGVESGEPRLRLLYLPVVNMWMILNSGRVGLAAGEQSQLNLARVVRTHASISSLAAAGQGRTEQTEGRKDRAAGACNGRKGTL